MKMLHVHGSRPVAALAILLSMGGATASGGTNSTSFVSPGAVWKFLDGGIDPGVGWFAPMFDDQLWPEGPAKLGFGAGDEATWIDYGPDPLNKYITTYFRRSFEAGAVTNIDGMELGVWRENGVVVYLNGVEVLRHNMPAGEIGHFTLATTNLGGPGPEPFVTTNLPPVLLLEGNNVLAVETHLATPADEQLGFDLFLSGLSLRTNLTRGPYVQLGSTTNMTIRWRTDVPTETVARYGTAPADLSLEFADTNPTTEHAARLAGLQPGTRYFYRVGTRDLVLAGDESCHFVTTPTNRQPIRIWVVGDTRVVSQEGADVRDRYYAYLGSTRPDVWLHTGDLANSGWDFEYQTALFDVYPLTLRQTPLIPTLGNHDVNWWEDLPFLKVFDLPTQGEAGGVPSGSELYYSFDFGNVHFVCLDSYISAIGPGTPMLTWLERDLTANTNEWLVAYFHSPPYSRGSHNSDWEWDMVSMRTNLVPILEAHGVDLVINGHSHSYERSYLLDGHYGVSTTLTGEMILDRSDGWNAGQRPYRKPLRGPVPHRGAVFCVVGDSSFTGGGTFDHPAMCVSWNLCGSLAVTVDDDTLTAVFLEWDGTVGDRFQIVKGPPPDAPRLVYSAAANGLLKLAWQVAPGFVYQVERASTLTAPDWTPVATGLISGQETLNWSTPIDRAVPAAFFRVVKRPN